MNPTTIRNGLILAGIVIALIVLCCSCGPAALLKRSDRLLNLAIKRGAKVERDTLWKQLQFNIKGPSVAVNLRPLFNPISDGTKYIFKDTVIYAKAKGKSGPPVKAQFLHDTLYVDCPDSLINASVPVAVNTEVSAGFTNFQHYSQVIGGIVFGVVAGVLLGRVLKLIR